MVISVPHNLFIQLWIKTNCYMDLCILRRGGGQYVSVVPDVISGLVLKFIVHQ